MGSGPTKRGGKAAMIGLLPSPDEMAWQAKAACADEDPELFYPDPSDRNRIAAAKAVCSRCPVWRECRRWGFRIEDRHAVLGGLTVAERRAARRRVRERAQREAARAAA